jgi:hypothetical protein
MRRKKRCNRCEMQKVPNEESTLEEERTGEVISPFS